MPSHRPRCIPVTSGHATRMGMRQKVVNSHLSLFSKDVRFYAEAEPLLTRSLAIIETALGPEHPEFAMSLNNLALLYDDQGRYAEAEPLYKRDLAIQEKALGPEHPNVATSFEHYAVLLRATGRTAEADKMEARAKEIRVKRAE